VTDHCGWATVQPSDGLSVPTNQPLTKREPEPYQITQLRHCDACLANMPAAPQPFEPAGLCPDQPQGDMNLQPQIKPLASSDVGGTAGHDAAACVSARGKCDGASVCDARDANIMLSPTTLSLQARQVVAPQAQNSGAGAAAIALVPQPSTLESAGADASKVSIAPSAPSASRLLLPSTTTRAGRNASGRPHEVGPSGLPSAALQFLPSVLPSALPSLPSVLQSALPPALPSVLPPALPLLTLLLPPLPPPSLPLPYPSRPGKASPTTKTGR